MRLGKYRNFKTGKEYRIIAIGKHSETLEDMVVYEALYQHPLSQIWVRPKAMFEENVVLNGKTVPRFEFVGEE